MKWNEDRTGGFLPGLGKFVLAPGVKADATPAQTRPVPVDTATGNTLWQPSRNRPRPRWISTQQLTADTMALMSRLPTNLSAIVGVARSGMLPASVLATGLHLPLYALDQERGLVRDVGHGWRLNERPKGRGPVLVMDDTTGSGRSLRMTQRAIGRCSGCPFKVTEAMTASRVLELGDVTINISGIGDQPSGWWRHSRACELAETIPQWDSLYKFAVMRNPFEIVESFWRLVQRDRVLLERPRPEFPKSAKKYWEFVDQTSRMTFEEWIPWHFRYLEGSGGFWRYWCCGRDGADLGVEMIRFDRLGEEWPRICERLRMHGLELPHVNGAAARVELTESAARTVGELCADDVGKFGYTP